MQTVADIDVRPQREDDYEALVRIHQAVYPDMPVTADEIREREAEIDPSRYVHVRLVAEDRKTGEVVAVGNYSHLPWSFHPDRYRARLNVHPNWQHRGIGRRLMDEMLVQLDGRAAKWVKASAREDLTRSVAFLQRHGFVEHARAFESRLQVDSCRLEAFAGYAQRVADLGIVLTTLQAELGRDPTCPPAVYEMHCLLDIGAPRDDPGLPTPPTYEDFLTHGVRSPRALHDAFFLAKFGDLYIGESALKRSDADPKLLHQELTGVVPECRGLGIATALKLKTVEYARQHGYLEIRTWNNSKNGPMLAINGKLGFVRQPAWIEFQLTR